MGNKKEHYWTVQGHSRWEHGVAAMTRLQSVVYVVHPTELLLPRLNIRVAHAVFIKLTSISGPLIRV